VKNKALLIHAPQVCQLALILLILCPSNLFSQEHADEIPFSEHRFLPGYNLKKINHTQFFQGNRQRKAYFEGWYFKMVSADGESILSVIPGISLSKDGSDQHAFIQLIDGKSAVTEYISYPIEDFYFSRNEFAIRIGPNYFSDNRIILDIDSGAHQVSGSVQIIDPIRLKPGSKKKKAIMGWYRFVPFMQCYHGVVSLSHKLNGEIIRQGKTYNFSQGNGYIEKDWGKSMPSAWIWMQSNHFDTPHSSFMLSVAHIPWLGSSFTGFLGFFHHDGQIHRFGTYSKAELNWKQVDSTKIEIIIQDQHFTYRMQAERSRAGVLKAPVDGSMDRRIAESIDAKLHLVVMNKAGEIIFDEESAITGLELVGELQTLK
jgi:tocopherol cyclase